MTKVGWRLFSFFVLFSGAWAAEEEGFGLLEDTAFTARNRGSEMLAKWADADWKAAGPVLVERYFQSSDPETRHRLRAILADHFRAKGPAHLGITFKMGTRAAEDGGEIATVVVVSVSDDGSAEKSGIMVRDEISAFGSEVVTDKAAFVSSVKALQAGEKVDVKLFRNGQEITVRVNLLPKPDAEEMTEEDREAAFGNWLESEGKLRGRD